MISPLMVYYGPATAEALEALALFRVVIVQTTQYDPADLRCLRLGGTRVLGYLSLGEDHTLGARRCVPGSAPYHRQTNPAWDSVAVKAAHPEWQQLVLRRAADALREADGLLLDTLGSAETGATLQLIRQVREQFPQATLLANRGFNLLPQMKPWINGIVFEAFSTTHTPAYAAHDQQGLKYTAHWLDYLTSLELPTVALDYADTSELAAFARARAKQFQLPTCVTQRRLDLPGGMP